MVNDCDSLSQIFLIVEYLKKDILINKISKMFKVLSFEKKDY